MTLTLVAAVFVLGIGISAASPDPPLQTYMGKTAEGWHWRYVKEHRSLAEHGRLVRQARLTAYHLRKALIHRPSSLEAIRLMTVAYGLDYGRMYRVADCESPGLSPTLRNSQSVWNGEHATGLFQFLPSTFASTPYDNESIYSPYANALAAGWMWTHGRGDEWVCQG